MLHWKSLLVGLIVMLLTVPGVSGETLFEEDFDGGQSIDDMSKAWQFQTGQWELKSGALQGSDCPDGWIAAGAKAGKNSWKDYKVSLRMKMASRGSDWRDGPWIGFRHRDGNNAYTVGFYNRMTALHKASKGKLTGDQNELATSPYTLEDSGWHDVDIYAAGNTVGVAVDGKMILAAKDQGFNDSPAVESGGIVLGARRWANSSGHTRVLFDNVSVETISSVPAGVKNLMEKQREIEAFKQAQAERSFTNVPRKVLAFYYPWYGTPDGLGRWRGWRGVDRDEENIANTAHYPEGGPYDSHDVDVIDGHIKQARTHGIDAFISSWWGPRDYTDRALPKILDRAEEHGLEVSVYWETVPGSGERQIRKGVNDIEYLMENYADHPAFLKVDGKPVIFVYGRIMQQVHSQQWCEIIPRARKQTGRDFVLIADGYTEENARLFEGVHTYNPVPWVVDTPPAELPEKAEGRYESAVQVARQFKKLSCLTVIPGYKDTQIREPGLDAKRHGGRTYHTLWQEAIEAKPDWVLITTWNEWYEGSTIETSVEYGDKYLELTDHYASEFTK